LGNQKSIASQGEFCHNKTIVKPMDKLHNIISKDKTLKKTPEGKWLMAKIKQIKNIEKTGYIVILGTGAWKLLRWQNGIAELGLQNSFSNIYAVGTLTVVIHELDQRKLNYIPSDTHVSLYYLPIVIEEINKSNLGDFAQRIVFEKFRKTPASLKWQFYKSDMLFACNCYHGIIFLEMFFKKYLNTYLYK
jgi:hypothetical protein